MDVEMALDSRLLLFGQIVMSHIRSTDIILLDNVLP